MNEKWVFCKRCLHFEGSWEYAFCWHPSEVRRLRNFRTQANVAGDPKELNRYNNCPLYVPNRRTRLMAWIRKVTGRCPKA